MTTGYAFQALDKDKLLKIYQLGSKITGWKTALDQMLSFCRQYFIFDNVAIYLAETLSDRIDVVYARAMGRGRSKEADVSWGEIVASRVIAEQRIILEESQDVKLLDRLNAPYIFGIPLKVSNTLTGALVFIRFGGPSYEKGSREYVEILAAQFTSILRRKSLDDLQKELEMQRSYTALQGNFINTISHEFRNPLGFIRGYTSTLLREDTNWDQKTQHDFLEIIDRETNNLSKLIDDLLDSSRLQSGNMRFDFQLLHLGSILRDEVDRVMINDPTQVVKLEIADNLPFIKGDPRWLAQVFANLINNSQKYAPGAPITIKAYSKDINVIIEYSDAGPGLEEKYLPMVFSRFFRAPGQSSSVRGSGLGLSICKQIIESHAGEMIVLSKPGKGLTFNILLPQEMQAAPGLMSEE